MTSLALGAAILLVILIGGGLVRVALGPLEADRILGLQLAGTTLAALCLTLAIAFDRARLVDLALVIAASASVTTMLFYALRQPRGSHSDGDA